MIYNKFLHFKNCTKTAPFHDSLAAVIISIEKNTSTGSFVVD